MYYSEWLKKREKKYGKPDPQFAMWGATVWQACMEENCPEIVGNKHNLEKDIDRMYENKWPSLGKRLMGVEHR